MMYLKLLREYMVVLRWNTNTIEPDFSGGQDIILSWCRPWTFAFVYTTLHLEYYFRFDGRFWCTDGA